MAKAKFEYQQDDVVRKGMEIDTIKWHPVGVLYGVWARKFDPTRREMGGWVMVSKVFTDLAPAQEAWSYYADHLRGEGAMTAVLVQINRWNETAIEHRNIGRFNCSCTALDVRSSALLQGPGGVSRTTAPDCLQLCLAINRDMESYLAAQGTMSDDAARDRGHDTATGTPEQVPPAEEHTNGDGATIPPAIPETGEPVGAVSDPHDAGSVHPVIDVVSGRHSRKSKKGGH